MPCRIAELTGPEVETKNRAIFYDSVTMTAFGPILKSLTEAWLFLTWLNRDPRLYSAVALQKQYELFCKKK